MTAPSPAITTTTTEDLLYREEKTGLSFCQSLFRNAVITVFIIRCLSGNFIAGAQNRKAEDRQREAGNGEVNEWQLQSANS